MSIIKAYHTTSTKHRDAILTQGLIPQARKRGLITYEPRIFFSKKRNDVSTMDFINQWDFIDVWEVQIEESLLKKDTISHLDYHVYSEQPIPTNKLKLITHVPYDDFFDKESWWSIIKRKISEFFSAQSQPLN